MRTLIFTLLLSLPFISFSQSTDCQIFDLIVEAHDCVNDSFLVDIDFNFFNVGDNGFTVAGNGNIYGTFGYDDLFITIGPLAGDGTNYEFIVQDVDSPDCAADYVLGEINCEGNDCQIFDLVTDLGDCTSDSTYNLWINFEHQGTMGVGFDLFANGDLFGFYEYEDLPLLIANFPKSGSVHDWIKVCENDNDNCCATLEFESPDCGGGGDCHYWDIVVDFHECSSDSTYHAFLNFNHEGTTNAFFDLNVNGEFFSFYEYEDLPLFLENVPQSGMDYDWVTICDNDNPDCCATEEYESPDCGIVTDCAIYDLVAEAYDCENDSFYVDIDFEYQDVGQNGFIINGNGFLYGFFEYGDLPITLGPFPADETEYEFAAIDVGDESCHDATVLGIIDCDQLNKCNIWDLGVEVFDCENDSFYLELFFHHQNGGASGFQVLSKCIHHGVFPYTDSSLILGPLPADGSIGEILVQDVESPECFDYLDLEEIDCHNDCRLWDLVVDPGDCTSDSTYVLHLNFFYENTSGDHFDLYANGEFFGFYAYSDLPLTIQNFPKQGHVDWVKVCDNDMPDCCTVREFVSPNCGEPDECQIYELDVQVVECENDTFWFRIDFLYMNVGDHGFEIHGNGHDNGTYEYADLPVYVGPLPADETVYEILVRDVDHPDCQRVREIGLVDCGGEECELWDLVVDLGECTSDSTYRVTIDFEYQGVSGAGFDLYANGSYFGFYSYQDLPLTIDEFPLSGEPVDWIQVCENDREDCCTGTEYEAPDCMTPIHEPTLPDHIRIYPNPASSKLQFDITDGPGIDEWMIVDPLGQLTKTGVDDQVDLEGLASGFYYLLIQSDGWPYVWKFVKE